MVSADLSVAKEDVTEELYRDIADHVNRLIVSSVESAQGCFPVKKPPLDATLQSCHARTRNQYVPMAMAKQFQARISGCVQGLPHCMLPHLEFQQQSMRLPSCVVDQACKVRHRLTQSSH